MSLFAFQYDFHYVYAAWCGAWARISVASAAASDSGVAIRPKPYWPLMIATLMLGSNTLSAIRLFTVSNRPQKLQSFIYVCLYVCVCVLWGESMGNFYIFSWKFKKYYWELPRTTVNKYCIDYTVETYSFRIFHCQ